MSEKVTISGKAEMEKERRSILDKRLHFLFRRVKEAQKSWNLVEEGDRILIALSGGKDSTTLCHIMAHWRDKEQPDFEVQALHAQVKGSRKNASNRKDLAEYLVRFGIRIDFVEMDHDEFYSDGRYYGNCFRCAWKRRKKIFIHAADNGFNKVAFGHHLDDAVETVLMNLLFHGNLDTMEPQKDFFGGKITLIRPLILAEEKEVKRVSSQLEFPFYDCLCPADHVTQRDAAKAYIQSFGRQSRMIKKNIWRASRKWAERCADFFQYNREGKTVKINSKSEE